MKITRKDILTNDSSYREHLLAEGWKNAIWTVDFFNKNVPDKEKAISLMISTMRNMMRIQRKMAIRQAARKKGGK